ncbi:hypothetical protein [Amaricoccus sp. W119]|uniref:hypothetical protein n=1 Tax=Amaricoccus sp. W119 TaxID=3391833 RepID=UPI0039A67841
MAQAVPGDRLEYHRGFLVLDIFPIFARLPDQQRAELARLGSRAFWTAEQGLVHLEQERTGPDQFAYIAVARPKPKPRAPIRQEMRGPRLRGRTRHRDEIRRLRETQPRPRLLPVRDMQC